jgi:hypothetical protein
MGERICAYLRDLRFPIQRSREALWATIRQADNSEF